MQQPPCTMVVLPVAGRVVMRSLLVLERGELGQDEALDDVLDRLEQPRVVEGGSRGAGSIGVLVDGLAVGGRGQETGLGPARQVLVALCATGVTSGGFEGITELFADGAAAALAPTLVLGPSWARESWEIWETCARASR